MIIKIKSTVAVILVLFMGQAWGEDLLTGITSIETTQLNTTEYAGISADVNVKLLTSRLPTVDIELPSGQRLTAIFKSGQSNHIQGYSWRGHVSGDDAQIINLSVFGDAIAGSIHTDKAVYEIQPLGNYRIKLVELKSHAFPECDGGEPVMQPMAYEPQQLSNETSSRAANTVDVIVVYTPEARNGAGGHNAIRATAQAAVDAMNSSMVNSLVDTEIVLLYAGEVNYNDSTDSATDLAWLQASSEVENLKVLYGADMAGLLVDSLSGSCGRGYVMRNPGPGFRDYAVQVTARTCAVGNLSFAHEFGHNMGLEHNPENSSATPATASYAWSFGHYHDGSYRTVMSYSSQCGSGCTRQQYFSNPNVTFNSLATGIDNERDNARTLGLTAPVSAAFRIRASDVIFMNGFE